MQGENDDGQRHTHCWPHSSVDRDIRDELKEGDLLLVKVISIDGNKIRLSRKAVLRDQRAKAGHQPQPEHQESN